MRRLPSYPNPLLDGWRLPEGVPRPNLWYRFCRYGYQILAAMMWRLEVFNRHIEPASGSVLYLCNHQSFLDPALMGMGLRRPVNYMARDSLFRNPLFGRFIASLNAFPVKRGQADTGAMKEALRRLKAGGQLVVFPEGTRTRDGTIGPFLPGVSLLARRAADWVVPMVIDGAFEAWPRTSPLPRPRHVEVAYCRPLGREDIARLTGEEILDLARRRMIDMQTELRRRLGRPKLEYGA